MNTTSGEVSRVIDQQQVQNLALNGRNYIQLLSFVPGVALLNDDQLELTTSLATNNQSINGNRGQTNNVTIDGGFNLQLTNSHTPIMKALEKEGIAAFPVVPSLREVARFEFFRESPSRMAGVWVVRRGALRFALPITTGPKPGLSDYLPAPHGLAGFAAPVEQIYPVLTPYVELADGRTVVATDGADVIEPGRDGLSLRVRWNKWAVVGTPSGKVQDVGLVSEVVWRIEKGTLTREETLSAKQPVSIRRWRLVVPSTYDQVETEMIKGVRVDRFYLAKGSLDVRMMAVSFPVKTFIVASGDSAIGRGVHGAIPLHLVFEATDIQAPLKYKIALTPK